MSKIIEPVEASGLQAAIDARMSYVQSVDKTDDYEYFILTYEDNEQKQDIYLFQWDDGTWVADLLSGDKWVSVELTEREAMEFLGQCVKDEGKES